MSTNRVSILPSGWAEATLPDLVGSDGLLTDGDWVETEDQDVNGDVRLTQLADVGDGFFRDRSNRFMTSKRAFELNCTFLNPGDVMIARMPDPLGRACIFPGSKTPCVTVVDVCIVRPANVISPRWLMSFVNAPVFRIAVADLQSGSTRKRISKANLSTIPIRVPPKEEQIRIADVVDSYFTRLDDAVATLERVQRNLKRYRASVLKAAVEGRLVPTEAELARAEKRDYEPASELLKRILVERRRRWEEAELAKMKASGKTPKDDKWKAKYEEPAPPDTSELPELPKGWCWATLPQLGELNRGKSKHRPRNDPRLLGGPYPFIQTGDVRRSECFIEAFEATYSEFGLAQSRLWPAGTLCITIAANIAETGILKFDSCFPDSVVGFLTFDSSTLTRYLELFLRTARADLARYAPSTAQKNINLETLSTLVVPLPPAAEQIRMVEQIDHLMSIVQHNEVAVHTAVVRSQRLRQTILKWAFEGKLVDQDPSDEPASVLLDRIRAERAATSQKNSSAKKPRRNSRNA